MLKPAGGASPLHDKLSRIVRELYFELRTCQVRGLYTLTQNVKSLNMKLKPGGAVEMIAPEITDWRRGKRGTQ
jgi:hypothetical protein